MSPLLGRSRFAYSIWQKHRKLVAPHHTVVDQRIFSRMPMVIIDATKHSEDVETTLASLYDPYKAIIVDFNGRLQGSCPSLHEVSSRIAWGATWLLLMRAGDILAPGAELVYAKASAETDSKMIYADDDALSVSGLRTSPHFKPQWNPELFRHFDYISGACIVKVDEPTFLSVADSANWIAELTSKIAALQPPSHIPDLLHHRKERPQPDVPHGAGSRADYDQPTVAVIIPTRNGTPLLMTCLEGLSRTDYPYLEIIIVDNDSDDKSTIALLESLDSAQYKVLRHNGPFNYSAINNAAVRETHSSFLCFLNNDIEIHDPKWLSTLVNQAKRDDVGAVGPMLLYPDGSIQHAGVVLGIGGGAAHAHRNVLPDAEGYFSRHALPQFVSAVTGACLVVKRERFDAAGGFDEENFPVAFNDVDLCMKLANLGFNSLYEPRARLVHHESKTRGDDRDAAGAHRLAQELAALKRIWHTDRRPDPYHHPSLSPYSEQFVIDL